MIVKSVNIGQLKKVKWRGNFVETGIFKTTVDSIILEKEDVIDDCVIDRRYHGGIDKACYLYSANHYQFWADLYPELTLNDGFFGENITINGLDESKIMIGDIYRIGGATIQVTQPRKPCYKLGIVFNTQKVLKQFINADYPGVYVKVLEGNLIKQGDSMELIERMHNSVSLLEVWHLLYDKTIDTDFIEEVLNIPFLADACKRSLQKRLNS